MRLIITISVIMSVLSVCSPLPAYPLFPDIDKYYIGENYRFGNGVSPHNEVCHDFNGDGVGDLFFLKPYDADDPIVHATILYGCADGTFLPKCDIEACCITFSEAYYNSMIPLILDADGDGLDDLLLTTGGSASYHVCYNTGTDTWTSELVYNWYMEIMLGLTVDKPLAACDCDDDGYDDFAAGSQIYNEEYHQPTMMLQYVPGSGLHLPSYTCETGGFVVWTDAGFGDFNGDGITDLMERSYYSGVRIHAGDGGCQFHYFDGAGTVLSGYAHIGNFNGDGCTDFVHTHEMMCTQTSYYAQVIFGGSDALSVGPNVSMASASGYTPLVVADINGDGKDDIGIIHEQQGGIFPVYIHYSEGETFGSECDTLHLPTSFPAQPIEYRLYSWDFNSDERDDLCYRCAPDTLAVLLNPEPVAVTLQSFQVRFDRPDGVVLDWKVTQDPLCEAFVIRRRTDRTEYFDIGRKNAIPGITQYTFVDGEISSFYGETITYRLDLIDRSGSTRMLAEERLTIPRLALTLHQNFPNPFNPGTAISFDLPAREWVSLEIFDVSGRLVKRLLHSAELEPGLHTVSWDGRNYAGKAVSSGIYYYRLTAGKASISHKMVLLH
ncbi:MAG: T9SS type A sorting domain-containing protein [bacterium]|nr:MAG: T9SS type A sorting domain-containing protein [bacterium]